MSKLIGDWLNFAINAHVDGSLGELKSTFRW